jgi:hypothetical protein
MDFKVKKWWIVRVNLFFWMRHKSGARRLFISVLAICYGGGGIQHCPRAFDLPKAKSTAGSLGTPIYNELPINISSAHSFIYI